MRRPSRQQRLKIIELAGFDIELFNKPSEDPSEPHVNMTWWHYGAIAFTRFLVRKVGGFSYAELPNITGNRADVFILSTEANPLGLIIQWEPSITETLMKIYNGSFFKTECEVITLSYNDFWDETGWDDESELMKRWYPKLQLPTYPQKFNWSQWWRQVRNMGVKI